jgi:hypothetical protein
MSYLWLIGPIIAVVTLAFVFVLFKNIGKGLSSKAKLLQTGIPAQARVLGVQHSGSSMSIGAHRHIELIMGLEVHPQGGQPYQLQSTQLISELQIPMIQPGAWLQIRVDQRNPHNVAIAGPDPGAGYGAGMIPGHAQAAYPGAPQPWQGGVGQPGQMPGGPMAAPGMMPGPMGAPGYPPMGAYGQAANAMAAQTAERVNKGMKRAFILSGAIMVLVTIPLAAVFVDWSAFGLSGDADAPQGGYCSALVRCCKKVFPGSGNCDKWEGLPGSGCKSAYESHKRSAEAMGKTCD